MPGRRHRALVLRRGLEREISPVRHCREGDSAGREVPILLRWDAYRLVGFSPIPLIVFLASDGAHFMELQTGDPFLGKVLSGRYEVLEPLGAGGMGRVYRAHQRPLGRLVAIKVLDPNWDRTRELDFEKRFFIEASATAKLRHPNTVRVYDYGRTDDGICFIAMELVEGETLRRLLSKSGSLPWPRALAVGAQVARSAREAHTLGLLHGDLKPSNIMLLPSEDGDEVVKVLDFGLAKEFTPISEEREISGETPMARTLVGSPLFVAPERLRGQADPRSDIYSLGIVLFQAISGRAPFTGRDPYEILVKHLREKPPQLDDPAVPAEVNHLVMKCLEKAPSARFQSMDELLEAMRQIIAGQGISGTLRKGDPFIARDSGVDSALSRARGAPDAAPPLAQRAAPPQPSVESRGPSVADETCAHGAKPEEDCDTAAGESAPRRAGLLHRRLPLIAGGAGLAFALCGAAISMFYLAQSPERRAHGSAQKSAAAPLPREAVLRAEVVLAITSEPPGAAVILGNKPVGTTPIELAVPLARDERGEPRSLELGFSLEGYLSATRAVQAREGPPMHVHQVLFRRPMPAPALATARARAQGPAPRTAQRSPAEDPTPPANYKNDPYQ